MSIVDKKELMQEDAKNHLFDVGITPSQLQERKIDLARTIDHTIEALNRATATGQTEIAAALKEKLEHLENLFDEILDTADALAGNEGSGKSGKGSKSDGGDKDKGYTGEKSETESDAEDETSEESDGSGEESEEGDSADGEEGSSKKSNTGDKPTRYGGRSGDRSSSDDSSSSSSSKSSFNPFNRRFGGGGGGEKPEESVFDAAKRILSELTGEAKRGAADGLKDLLSSRGSLENFNTSKHKYRLQESTGKSIIDMTDEEFDEEINSANELISQVLDIEFSDDLADRIAKIKSKADSRAARAELEADDAQYLKDEKKAKIASAREAEKYKRGSGLKGLDSFKKNLYRSVKDQIEEVEDEEDSWAVLDRRHEDEPSIIKKGTILDDKNEPSIPTINVYFDQSGSWSDDEIEIGKRAIRTINTFQEQGEIKLNVFYISAAGVCDTAAEARRSGGAEGWYDTLQHIVSSKVKNVIVLSDRDLDAFEWSNRPSGNNGKVVVDGCVWWLWKNARASVKAPNELVGRRGNFHYYFDT